MDNTVALTVAAFILFIIVVLLNFLRNQFAGSNYLEIVTLIKFWLHVLLSDIETNETEQLEVQQGAPANGGIRRAVAARNRIGLRNRAGLRHAQQDNAEFEGKSKHLCL